jgi:hypothetical protein
VRCARARSRRRSAASTRAFAACTSGRASTASASTAASARCGAGQGSAALSSAAAASSPIRYASASRARARSGARRPGVVLRPSLVHLHLGHVGRGEVAGLQAGLRRLERVAEELGGLVEHLGALLRLLQVEVGPARRGNLLAQHVERVALCRAPQPGRRVEAQRALVAALEGLVDAEHRVRPLGAARDAGAVDREGGIGPGAGDRGLRIGGLERAPRRQQLAVVAHDELLDLRECEIARKRRTRQRDQDHDWQ